jgi:hypothetical protein
MKHLFWASLIAVGLLLNSVAVAGEHEGPSLRNSRVNRAVALSGKKDFGTKTITGCLLNGSAAQEYLLLGSQDDSGHSRATVQSLAIISMVSSGLPSSTGRMTERLYQWF